MGNTKRNDKYATAKTASEVHQGAASCPCCLDRMDRGGLLGHGAEGGQRLRRPEQIEQAAQQMRFARAGRPGDAEHVGAAGALVDGPHDLGHLRGAVLDPGDQARERQTIAVEHPADESGHGRRGAQAPGRGEAADSDGSALRRASITRASSPVSK